MTIRTVALVPAAGSGRRLGSREKKPFIRICGKPLIVHTLRSLSSSGCINRIIVAAEPSSVERMKALIDKYRINKVAAVVKGGKTRSESVRNGFKAITGDCDIVLIHDGARPFPSNELIKSAVLAAKKYGACIAAIPVTDTVKLSDRKLFVRKTVDRSELWRAQTPQAFKYDILKKALAAPTRFKRETDDASVVERIGRPVKILQGSTKNIKITTKDDLKVAEVLL